MASDAALEALPEEILENIAQRLTSKHDIASLRLSFRKIYSIATKLFEQANPKREKLAATKTTVEKKIAFYGDSLTKRRCVTKMVVDFPASHEVKRHIKDLEERIEQLRAEREQQERDRELQANNDNDDDPEDEDFHPNDPDEESRPHYDFLTKNIEKCEKDLASSREKLQVLNTSERKKAPTSDLLALFPKLIDLKIDGLNSTSLETKLPLSDLRDAITTSKASISTLTLHRCSISSSELGTLLSIFPAVKRLTIDTPAFTDGYPAAARQLLLHTNAGYMDLQGCGGGLDFWPEGREDGVRQFRRKYRVLQHYRLERSKAEMSGVLAVKHALALILDRWLGREVVMEVMRTLKAEGRGF